MFQNEVYSRWFNVGAGLELEPDVNLNGRKYTGENNTLFYLSSANDNFSERLNDIINRRPKFFCINDVETDPAKRKIVASQMLSFFKKYFPNNLVDSLNSFSFVLNSISSPH